MRIELRNQIRLPYSYEYLNKGTVLLVVDEKGAYYVCRTDNDTVVCVHKDECKEVK